MKSVAFLSVIIFSLSLSAQNKYWVYFKDKNPSVSADELRSIFSEKILQKKLASDSKIDWYDFPIKKPYTELLKKSGLQIINESRWLNAVTVFATEDQIESISNLSFVKSTGSVVRLRNRVRDKSELDAHFAGKINKINSLDYGSSESQNNLTKLSNLHSLGISGNGISVGLIDEGTKWQDHEAFSQLKLEAQKNFVTIPEGKPANTFTHGTATLSLMGAFMPGKMIGGTFDSKFYLAETEYSPNANSSGAYLDYGFEEDNMVAAFEWMEASGVDVVNTSLGYLDFIDRTSYSYANGDLDGKTALCTIAADIAALKGVAIFVSAGNEGNTIGLTGSISPPSDGFHVFTSGAVNSSGTIAGFSSRGPTNDNRIKPDGMSMGSNCEVATPVTSKVPAGGYEFGNGTSYASPLSASAGALILSVYPELKSDEVYDALRQTASQSNSPNKDYGWGVIDVEKALYKIGPAVSNQFSVSYSGNNVSLNGFLKWDESVDAANTKLILYKSLNDSVIFENTIISADTVIFSGTFTSNQNDSVFIQIVGKTINGKSFSWPTNKDFKRVLIYGESETRAENLRRSNSTHNYYFTDTTEQKPLSFFISNPYPNPFNPEVNLRIFAVRSSPYAMNVYNITGQLVDSFSGRLTGGQENFISWNASNRNSKLSSGIYLMQFSSNQQIKTMKVILLK